ncbi:MAG: 2-C-methyl-D-erythritol 2,4-cyclodiphosphate synthase [Oscillospiraceae bacterium]|nr:2-C-methyl-D-erythritol 2,4-cyclodiphosphate synthase [Oscillospiraceae bacterium]MBQ3237209.1 2-C-methyl-D-erythritol 2,4-cyclodiphosphate synthase [Oscillospiraceae bacterium]MBQ3561221.1 2-C-methyl-D-erythritol 2,4-cyclodiphosphate synthase [Oscillospiraceae bacterium]MBQ4118528.1 2-C-methyl-D-erythritol 2,4-cyclodiphosphate synthase [Oscillospiraceae bacterium]
MIRIGHGYDVHRLVEGRRLVLGGVEIPYEKGLLGHSDADVLAHAAADALLGALALPDIGRRFPDKDPKYKDADSIELLKDVYSEVSSMGYSVCNMDCTVIAEKPMLKPFIEQMRAVLAGAMSTDAANINIKATTEEGLGLGGEGIGAHAVVLLEKQK